MKHTIGIADIQMRASGACKLTSLIQELMKHTDPTLINQKRFIRLYKDTFVENSGMRLCFLLGAGASSSSGILTKTELAQQWLSQIEEDLDEHQLERWKKEVGLSLNNIGRYYSPIFKKRFQFNQQLGHALLQQQITDAKPGLGYQILARILEKTHHNLALSDNPDLLLEDALFSVASKTPFQCGQELISEEALLQLQRPLIIKLQHNRMLGNHPIENQDHRDHQEELSVEFKQTLDAILKNFRLVVIGQSSKHELLLNYLSSQADKQRQPIFWCVRDPQKVRRPVKESLTERDFLVDIDGFDELLFQMVNSTDSQHLMNLNELGRDYLITIAEEKAKHYEILLSTHQNHDIDEPLESIEDRDNLLVPAENQFEDFLSSLEEPSREAEESAFKTSLDKEPNSTTHNLQYALFLEECNEYETALKYFNNAAHLAPDNEKISALYACFIAYHYQDYETAEEYYQKAIEINPEDAAINVLYGIFLHNIRRMFKAAESYFMAAYQTTTHDIQYSDFMKEICKDYRISEILYKNNLEKTLKKELEKPSKSESSLSATLRVV